MYRAALLASLVALSAFGDTYPRQPAIDVVHYTFRLTLGDDSDEITGEATVAVRFLKDGLADFSLDLATPAAGEGMTVSAVTSGSSAVRYTHQSDRLLINLPSPSKSGERREFTIRYRGVPAGGLYFSKNSHGDRGIFSVNWPNLARQWLPMVDHPYDKATSEFLITAPAKYQVVANGLLQEVTDLGDGLRLTHWKQSVPIASWLNAIAVAQFAARHFDTAAGIPLQTWVPYQDRESGIASFEKPTRQAVEFFNDHIGPFPYEKLADVWASAPGFSGGTEHASVIFYGCCRSGSGVVWHEIAHQWFGDSITEKDWDDVWLSEGFATYFTHLTGEHYDGRDALIAGLKRDRARIFTAEQANPGATVVHNNLADMKRVLAPSPIIYQKGGWVLHMLRGQVGTETFWAGIRDYYRRYRDSNASSADFRKVMEENSGRDLAWFFDQWLHRSPSPAIEGGWKYNSSTHKIELDLTQTQPGDPYRLPIEIAVASGTGTKIEKIELTRKQQHFEIDNAQAPSSVLLDPNTWLLLDSHFK